MSKNQLVRKVQSNKILIENFSYISALQIFILLTPLITYPYLTRVLGTELYGLVITAQVLASYAMIIVKFGFDDVSARYVSIHREEKKELAGIMSSIMAMRIVLWIASLGVYLSIVLLVPIYRNHFMLFFYSFGITFSTLLFPQFFFQGIEKMKYITAISVLIQSVFIILTFIVIKKPADYVYVPLLHAIGYLIGGIVALLIISKGYGINFHIPTRKQSLFYLKDALPLFATDAVCTIKDKLNYLLLGVFVNMSDVVIYDIGSKLTNIAIKPLQIINTVIFPKMAKDKNNKQFKKFGVLIFVCIMLLTIGINIFLHPIVYFLIGKDVPLLPIRLYLLSPLFLGLGSYIGHCLIVARGYNRFMFYSILLTTTIYLLLLVTLLFTHHLNTIMVFIGLTVASYFVELLYRIYISRKILKDKGNYILVGGK